MCSSDLVLRIQDEVEKLWKSLEEKDAKVTSLKEKMAKAEKENEEAIKMSNADMTRIKEQDKSTKELHTSLKAANDNITSKDIENQKIVETLEQLRGNSFAIASRCCDALKKIFSLVGATSRATLHTSGDTERALE